MIKVETAKCYPTNIEWLGCKVKMHDNGSIDIINYAVPKSIEIDLVLKDDKTEQSETKESD